MISKHRFSTFILSSLVASSLACLSGTACSSADAADPVSPPEPVDAREEPFATSGVERVIPIRVHRLRNATTPDALTDADVERAIDYLNAVYLPAGVQFTLRGVSRHAVGSRWYDFNRKTSAPWNGAGDGMDDDLVAKVWQGACAVSSNGTEDPLAKLRRAVETCDTERDAIQMFVPDALTGGDFGTLPQEGRMVLLDTGAIQGQHGTVAHEVGHYFGLPHTFRTMGPNDQPLPFDQSTNPELGPQVLRVEDGQPIRPSDFWDLFYARPNGVTKFFNGPVEAAACEGDPACRESMVPINDYAEPANANGSRNPCGATGDGVAQNNCCVEKNPTSDTFTFKCRVAGIDYDDTATLSNGAPNPLLGKMFFRYGGDSASSFRRGVNAMSYVSGGAWAPAILQTSHYVSFSASQIHRIRQALRYDHFGTGRRRLGAPAATPSRRALDLDGDGRRDLVTFNAKTGEFDVRLSCLKTTPLGSKLRWQQPAAALTGFGSGLTSLSAAVADFDGDGREDLGVYGIGSDGLGYWEYCTAHQTACGYQCGTKTRVQFGGRDMTPLPGLDMDGNPQTGEVAVFQGGSFYWRGVNAGGITNSPPYTIVSVSGGAPVPVKLADGDAATDLVTWSPGDNAYHYKSSVDGFSAERVVALYSGSVSPLLLPFTPAGTTSIRSALGGWTAGSASSGQLGSFLASWAPPLSTVAVCQHGGEGSLPLPGFFDQDGDGFGDAVVAGVNYDWSMRLLYRKTFSPGGCGAASSYLSTHAFSRRAVVFAVPSLDGDALDDVAIFEPGAGASATKGGWDVTVLQSSVQYSAAPSSQVRLSMGSNNSLPL